jgi:radical SAM superfamily enzyme YgiQ (UPF0313 family)
LRVLLISTYELGRQPFGLASPAAILRAAGHQVQCVDSSQTPVRPEQIRQAELIAFSLPMHTAARLAIPLIQAARRLNPQAHLCCYGLYAAMNGPFLRQLGVGTLIGGEFENALAGLAARLERGRLPIEASVVSLERIDFAVPDRDGLPSLNRYAALVEGENTKVSGCKHRCRHCPIVPVYDGVFRVVPAEIVLADIRQQVESGARHISFGDPDFFNGPTHGMRIVEAAHREFPALTYDVTIKIEHLLEHRNLLGDLKRTGCVLVTSAVESVDDEVLARLEKGHTRKDFFTVVALCRETELALSPTFIPFTPWTSWDGYRDLLRVILDLGLVDSVAPVQLALRLLITAGSRLLELPEIAQMVEPFQPEALLYRWSHSDPTLDHLAGHLLQLVDREQKRGATRSDCFAAIWNAAHQDNAPELPVLISRAAIPYLNEPWYC